MPTTHRVKVRTSRTGRQGPLHGEINITGDYPQSTVNKIMQFNQNPNTRNTAASYVNHAATTVIRYAKDIADAEFRDRPSERRPRPGTRHYRTSFFFHPATQDSIGRLRARYGNSHRAAWIIERGARPHVIAARGIGFGGRLKYPFKPDAQGTHPGTGITPGIQGTWPTEYGPGVQVREDDYVNHPGTPAFHIMKRASTQYRREINRLKRR